MEQALTDEEKKEIERRRALGELKLPGQTDSVEKFISFAADTARGEGFSEERISQIVQALSESFTNIVNHAFRETEGEIDVKCSLDRADRLVFKIVDTGSSFNMLFAGDPLFADEYAQQGVPKPSTRLTKKQTETIEYQRIENRNYLTLTFSRVVKG